MVTVRFGVDLRGGGRAEPSKALFVIHLELSKLTTTKRKRKNFQGTYPQFIPIFSILQLIKLGYGYNS